MLELDCGNYSRLCLVDRENAFQQISTFDVRASIGSILLGPVVVDGGFKVDEIYIAPLHVRHDEDPCTPHPL